jgi:hypothetical protein
VPDLDPITTAETKGHFTLSPPDKSAAPAAAPAAHPAPSSRPPAPPAAKGPTPAKQGKQGKGNKPKPAVASLAPQKPKPAPAPAAPAPAAKPAESPKPAAAPKGGAKATSLADHAAKVLKLSGKPMTAREISKSLTDEERGVGAGVAARLRAEIADEVQRKGKASRFKAAAEPGHWELRETASTSPASRG